MSFLEFVEIIKSFNITRFDEYILNTNICFTKRDKNILSYALRSKHFHYIFSIINDSRWNPNVGINHTMHLILSSNYRNIIPIILNNPKLNINLLGYTLVTLFETYKYNEGINFVETHGYIKSILTFEDIIYAKEEAEKAITLSDCETIEICIKYVEDIYEFVKTGFIPMKNKNEIEMFIKYKDDFQVLNIVKFWCNYIEDLHLISNWIYSSRTRNIFHAQTYCDSFALLFENNLLYKSMRPKTNMNTFITDTTKTYSNLNEITKTYIPITRYSTGMQRGLYHGKDVYNRYKGTFYYYEPESTTILTYKTIAIYKNKYQAALDFVPSALNGRFSAKKFQIDWLSENYSLLPKDLLMTPTQVVNTIAKLEYEDCIYSLNKIYSGEAKNIPQTVEYVGKIFGLYALNDSLDQDLCIAARKRKIDILVFEEEVGSRQLVKEVLDTRERTKSFSSLRIKKEY